MGKNMSNIIFVRGDDTHFLNQVLLIANFKTNLNLDGYHARLTLENSYNIVRKFEVQHNTVEINLDKVITSTIENGIHRANIKLIDTLDRVRTVYNFDIEVKDEFEIGDVPLLNEYELEIELDAEGISKYKNYDELHNKPSINNVVLEGDKTFDEIGITHHMIGISNTGIEKHNTDKLAHKHLQDQIFNKQDRLIAGSNITIIDGIISALGDNGGVTTDYKDLGNKPRINGIILDDELTLDDLGIQPKGSYVSEETLDKKGFLTSVPSGYVTEEELENKKYLTEVPEEYYTDIQNQEIYATKDELELKQNILTAGKNINISHDLENNELVISSNIPEEYITVDELLEYNYTTDDKLTELLSRKQNKIVAGDNIRLYKNIDGSYTISAIDSKNPVEISSYNSLSNKPSINNVSLMGNKTLEELGVQPKGNYQYKLKAGDNITISEDNTISANIPDDICTDTELNIALSDKADKSDTLFGYGIKDAYTKEETDENIKEYLDNKLTDTIIDAPNGILEYTENTITAKNSLKVLFSNGINSNHKYSNMPYTLTNDIILNTNDYESGDFYIVLLYENSTAKLRLINKENFKILNTKNIKNTETGYIRNINDNRFYNMIYQGNGIYKPENVLMKIIGECVLVELEDGSIRVYNIVNYLPYNILTQDCLSQYLKSYQPKLQFGENFVVENNLVKYIIPRNYTTKEYLIENNFATQTNVNDAIEIHNNKTNSHEDIRSILSELKNQIKDKVDYSFFNILSEKIIELEDKVKKIETEYDAIANIEDILKGV